MSKAPSVQRYDLITQLFHWSVVVLMVGLLVTDSLREGAPKPSDIRTEWLNLHMSLGILLFFVVIARLGWSRRVGKPDPCLLYTSPSPRDATLSRMPSSA